MIIDTTNWGWPQWTYVVLMLIGLIAHAHKHGQPRGEKYNFGTQLLAVIITVFILGYGGFFK